jgi:hypothetical protein
MMMNAKVLGIAAAGILAATALSGQAQAQVVCQAQQTVLSIESTPGGFTCTDQDKTYSNFAFSANVADTALVGINTQLLPTGDSHAVTLAEVFQASQTYTMSYDIEITAASQAAGNVFQGIQLSMNYISDATVSKQYTLFDAANANVGGATLTLVNDGGPNPAVSPPSNISPALGVVKISVLDTLVMGPGGQVDSISNRFRETTVTSAPVPATVALLGFGLVATGFMARRKRS